MFSISTDENENVSVSEKQLKSNIGVHEFKRLILMKVSKFAPNYVKNVTFLL